MSKPKEFERVDEAGLVNVVDVEAVGKVPLHYCHGKWYGPNRDGGFSPMKDTQAGVLLGQHGFSRSQKNEHGNTPADVVMLWLMQNRAVNYAGPLAGYPVGPHVSGQQRILVTEALRLVKVGKSGNPKHWPTIQTLVQSLFDDADHDQITVFYIWLAASLRHLYTRIDHPGELPFQHCPALAMFGEFQSGKSALIDLVLSPLFGGRKADPLAFLKEGKFNKDLFPAALLVMDDKGASSNLDERRQRGDGIKSLIWTEFQRMEGKGVDALMVAPFWRLVIAGNFEDSSLNICPALNDSLRDKIILLKCRRADGLPETEAEKIAWVKQLRDELPAFVAFLLEFKPMKALAKKLDKRSRVLNFWHPDIAAALLEKQPECKAIEVIDLLDLAPWHGTATEFYNAIREHDKGGHYERLFSSIDKCGRMLTELAKAMPRRVTKTTPQGISHYRIERKSL
jgi:Family of unknown function (DUF5906)